MKKLILTTAMAVILPFSASAQNDQMTPYTEMPAGNYSLDKTHASLIWKVSHIGLSNYTARFTDFDADLTYHPEDPAKSTLIVTVDPASLETDYPNIEKEDFDKKLSEGKDWFNTNEYPDIKFVSKEISLNDDKTGTVTGDLTFLGVTKPLTLNVTYNGSFREKPFVGIPAFGFSATGTLMRSEWGFDTYIPGIGDQVDLVIEAEFHKDQTENANTEKDSE